MTSIGDWWQEAGRRIGVSFRQPYPRRVMALLWVLFVLCMILEVTMAIWP